MLVRQRVAVLQLLAREDQALPARRDALLVLNLLLDVLDGVGGRPPRLARQRRHEDRCQVSDDDLIVPSSNIAF